MNEYPSMNVLGGMVVTREIWDKISHESQNKIKRISKAYHNKLIKANRAENDKSIEVLKKAGISIVHFEDTGISIEYISEIGKKARESLVGKLYSRELLDRTLSLLAEHRKNHPDSTIRRIGRIR
jgi:TRAP-type C4-dicarboxylate transport system substrate-binding protein